MDKSKAQLIATNAELANRIQKLQDEKANKTWENNKQQWKKINAMATGIGDIKLKLVELDKHIEGQVGTLESKVSFLTKGFWTILGAGILVSAGIITALFRTVAIARMLIQ